MNRAESVAACHLAADVVAEVTTAVEGVHRGILSRIRAVAGPDSPVGASVDLIEAPAHAVYAAVRLSSAALGHTAASVSSVAVSAGSAAAADTPSGSTWLAGLSAAWGDQLEDDDRTRPLAPPMSLRQDGFVLTPSQFVEGCESGGLGVFLHGLGGTEHQWHPSYQAALAQQGFAPALVRYNSGRAIHANGQDFADMMRELIAGLRARVANPRVILVGHSMGGLIIRSALGQQPAEAWLRDVTDVVTLGSPHHGAPLEKVSAAALRGLQQFRESSPIADFGNRRARGIKDLRFGALRPDHWGGLDPDEVLYDTTADVPLPAHVRHHAIVASFGGPGSLVGAVFGDGMVRSRSAAGRGDPPDRVSVHRLHSTGHLHLLRHPRVADILADVAAGPSSAMRQTGST